MIRRIQALNYRCLRHLDIALDRLHLLAGPHGSGKSTLFDVLTFLGDFVREGPAAAVAARTEDFRDLVRGRPEEGPGFELAIEFEIPDSCRDALPDEKDFRTYRYELVVGCDGEGARIDAERGILAPAPTPAPEQETLFPDLPEPPATLLATSRPGANTVLSKSPGNDWFYPETAPGRAWGATRVNLGPRRAALGSLPVSSGTAPVATALKRFLETGVKRLHPRAEAIRGPCPPASPADGFATDGSNVPLLVRQLESRDPSAFNRWLQRLRNAVPGLEGVRVAEREADNFAHLVLRYENDLEIPAHLGSSGTLRLLALTLLDHLAEDGAMYLVREPERGADRESLGAVRDTLSSVSGAQVLATTQSHELAGLFEPREVLDFRRGPLGETVVVRGDAREANNSDEKLSPGSEPSRDGPPEAAGS